MLFPNMVLLVSQDESFSIYCSNEEDAIKTAGRYGIYNKPGDKICLVDFDKYRSIIYELGEDLKATIY